MALTDLHSVLAPALREGAADVTGRALRAVVAARLGVALEGKNRAHFDKALLALTKAPETKLRNHCCFKLANRRAKCGQS